jgi:arylformamidase
VSGEILYDISQPIRPGMPVWPGDTDFGIERTWVLEGACPVNVSRLTMSTHTGTHADSPLHYHNDGAASADVPLAPYIGPCQVISVPARSPFVEPSHFVGKVARGMKRVLLHTYSRFPHEKWVTEFTAIHSRAIDALAAHGVVLVGTDAPSLDPQESKTLDAHHAVRRHGLAILEGLVLDGVPDGTYELVALPLKIAGADAAPVRAVLRALPGLQ